mmetsp:Transcript_160832/g.308907  ORF Transcript_160832/g.308907 Transcript_160832/m.308907 type:complete len:85 (+) Transcript_160832:56-310(+)
MHLHSVLLVLWFCLHSALSEAPKKNDKQEEESQMWIPIALVGGGILVALFKQYQKLNEDSSLRGNPDADSSSSDEEGESHKKSK